METSIDSYHNNLFKIKTLESKSNNKGFIPIVWEFSIIEYHRNILKVYLEDDYKMFIIVVKDEDEKTHRHIVSTQKLDIRDKCAWVSFQSSGHHTIYAFILKDDMCQLKYAYLSSDPKQPLKMFSTLHSTDWSDCEIVIPQDVFVTGPNKIERLWVDFFFEKYSTNSCMFNKRRLFAYSLQLPLFCMNYLLRCLTLIVCFLCGNTGLNFELLKHPMTTKLFDSDWTTEQNKNFLLFKHDTNSSSSQLIQFLVVSLPLIVVTNLITYLCCHKPTRLFVISCMFVGVVLLLILIINLCKSFVFCLGKIIDVCFDVAKLVKIHKRVPKKKNSDDILDELCSPVNSLNDVATQHKLRHKLQMLKNKTCDLYEDTEH